MTRWFVVGLWVGCGNNDPHPCDAGTPTCDSILTVLLADPRTDFQLSLDDGQGMDITVNCPDLDTGSGLGGGEYQVVCGAGRLTVNTYLSFGATITVQLEQAPEADFSPTYSRGGDFCGNPCNNGTIQL